MIAKFLCLIGVSVLPFLFSLQGDFVFDDTEAIINNKDVFSGSWLNAFYNDFWGLSINSNYSHKSYRPLTVLSFRANYFLNKKFSAVHFKITNLILHAICCIILWQMFESILLDLGIEKYDNWENNVAYSASLLFAVHPVHVEAVSGIVGRADILASITFFLGFLCYRKSITSKYSYFYLLAAIILASASMLFKENGVTVLGFCIIYDLVITFRAEMLIKNLKFIESLKVSRKHLVIRILCIIFAIFLLLCARWVVMGGAAPKFKPTDNPAAFSDSLFTRVASYNYIYFLNLLLLTWPQWLCYDWSMGCVPLIQDILDYRLLFIPLLYEFGLLVLIALVNPKNNGTVKRLIILSISLAVISFLPASNIFFLVGFVIAERILYIPSAGYCLLVSVGYHRIKPKYKISQVFFVLLIIVFGLRSWQRSKDWLIEYRLFTDGLSVCPMNAKIHYNMAKAIDSQHYTAWALREYKEAIRLHPEYYQAMNNLANLLKNQKRYSEAEHYLRTAIGIKNDFPAAWMNLGIVLASIKRYSESEQAYMTALKYHKNYPDCLYNLGNLYLEMNKTNEAMENWLKAVSFNSSHVLAWTNLLALLDNTDELEKALQAIPNALSAVPEAASVNFAVANIYGKLNLYVEAEEHFKKAIKLFGNKVQAVHYANLGVLYHRWKKYKQAEAMYHNALRVDPKFKSAQKNLANLLKTLDK